MTTPPGPGQLRASPSTITPANRPTCPLAMCGRFAQAVQPHGLVPRLQRERPNVRVVRWQDDMDQNEERLRPRYNTGPRSNVPVIRRSNGENVVKVMNWGLVPHWTKHEPAYSDNLNTINARSESLVGIEQPGMWKSMAPTKRCVIPVQGWFEWVTKGKKKIPYFMRYPDPVPATSDADDGGASTSGSSSTAAEPPFIMFAGLWDSVTYEEVDAVPLYTFTILTTSTSSQLSFIHTRMPVILHTDADINAWLDCDPSEKDASKRGAWSSDLAGLCKPFGRKGHEDLTCYPVPTEVGKVQNQSESFIHPVSERKDGIERFFKKTTSGPTAPPPAPDPDTLTPPATSSAKKGKTKEDSVTISDDEADAKPANGKTKEKSFAISDDDEDVKPRSPSTEKGRTKEESIPIADDDEADKKEESKSASSKKRKVPDSDEDEAEAMVKGEKDEGVVVLSDEDDEVIFVGEDKPEKKKAKPSSAATTPSSAKSAKKPRKKEKITNFFKPV